MTEALIDEMARAFVKAAGLHADGAVHFHDAARAALAVVRQHEGWRPIETAPRDGTTVLLWGIWAGEINGLSNWPTIDIGEWRGGKSDFLGDDWWQLVTGDAYAAWMRPTHWRPLPPPPEAAE